MKEIQASLKLSTGSGIVESTRLLGLFRRAMHCSIAVAGINFLLQFFEFH